jgi:oxygen-independent coproporphyrinogen-3 oxidase
MRLPNRPARRHQAVATDSYVEEPARFAPGGDARDWVIHPAADDAAVQPPEVPELYAQALQALAQRAEESVSLSYDLPFCAAHCLCCDRAILAAQPPEVIDDYVDGLIAETQAIAARIGRQRDVLQLHLGGGSASELDDAQLSRLLESVRDAWRVPDDAEMSIDCDPRRVGWMHLQLLHSLGFSQVTFGVLDLDGHVQKAIGRRHSAELIDDACEVARSCGIECVNLSLLIGLPHQSEESWRTTLRRLVAMAPDRLTLGRYRHRPRMAPGQYAIDPDALPDEHECRRLLAMAGEVLGEAGYRWIGSDHFVLENDPLALAQDQGRLRHGPLSYTGTPCTPLLAHGVHALSEVDGHVFHNTPSLAAWRQAVRHGLPAVAAAQPLTPCEQLRRAARQHLLCHLELPEHAVRGGLEPAYERLAALEQDGLVQRLDGRLVVTPAGRLALPMLCDEIDRARVACVDGMSGLPS